MPREKTSRLRRMLRDLGLRGYPSRNTAQHRSQQRLLKERHPFHAVGAVARCSAPRQGPTALRIDAREAVVWVARCFLMTHLTQGALMMVISIRRRTRLTADPPLRLKCPLTRSQVLVRERKANHGPARRAKASPGQTRAQTTGLARLLVLRRPAPRERHRGLQQCTNRIRDCLRINRCFLPMQSV